MSSVYKFCAACTNVSLAASSLTSSLYFMNSNFCSFIYSFLAGYSNNVKALRMAERADLEIGLQEETIKTRRKKKSSSKIFNRLLECLEKRLHPHMLYFTNDEMDEFEVILKHQRNTEWAPECIRLFRDLDKIKGHTEKVPNYSGATRTRFTSNMRKLCQGKYLKKIDTYKIGNGQIVIKYKILKGSGKEEPNCPAVKKNNRCGNKYGGGTMTDKKEKKTISETLDGPPPNNRMRTASPLVLPGINNIQDTGANPLNQLNPYVFTVLINIQNIGTDAMNGLSPHVPYDLNSNQDIGANTTLNGCNNTLNGSNLHVPYDINSNQDIGANTTLNGCNNTLNGSNLHVPFDINSNQDIGANTTLNGSNLHSNDEDNTFYDNEYKEMLVDSTNNVEEQMFTDSTYNEEEDILVDSPLLSSTADQEQDSEYLDSFCSIADFNTFSDFNTSSDFNWDLQCQNTPPNVCNV